MTKNSRQAKANVKPTTGKKTNPQYKDTVFTDLFYSDVSAKSNLLELANALLGTNYKSTEVLEKVRLEDALLVGQKNDVAFMVGNTQIILCEHQSTINYNMPVRLLQYIAKEYEQYIASTYGSTAKYRKEQLTLPEPLFFVLYNGKEELPDDIMRLSDAYISQNGTPELELTVQVINVNYAADHWLLKKCNILGQYSQMVEIVRTHLGKDSFATVDKVTDAVRECIQKGILRDYLLRKESEVIGMLSAEYDYEADVQTQREEAKREGKAEGKAEALISLVVDGLLQESVAAKRLNITLEEFKCLEKRYKS